MKQTVNQSVIELQLGDITQQNTEAIVNAANSSLRGGGGVDGAIHRAGGPAILEECLKLSGCETGDAKVTSAGALKAKCVIHAVGPVYRGGGFSEAELLARCYRRSLEIASERNLKSVAFPSISTGAYGYPVDQAAPIALQTAQDYLGKHTDIQIVRFVLFDEATYEAYRRALESLNREECQP